MNDDLLQAMLSPAAMAAYGLCVGSFLNVVIHRLPLMMERQWRADSAEVLGVAPPADDGPPLGLASPPSRCPHCGHRIRWYENIPLLSWAWLRGRCSSCKALISARYPFIEALTGALFAAVAHLHAGAPVLLAWCGFVAVLLALAAIDWDTTFLPDPLTLPLLWGGLIAAALGWTIALDDALWGAVAGYLSLWSVFWIFKLLTGKEGMGYGDFKLLAAIGAWLGWNMLLPVVLTASLLGTVVGVGMKLTGRLREGRYVPFGPFLAIGALVVVLAGRTTVLRWLHWA